MSDSSFHNSRLILKGFLKNLPKFMIFQNDSNNNSIFNLNRNSDISEKCGICLSEIIDPYRPINCNHFFCHKCILKWYKTRNNTCPICRKSFTMLAPKKIEHMKEEIKKSMYYKYKAFHLNNLRLKNLNSYINCDICQIKKDEDDLILCACCELFYSHYYCDSDIFISEHGYFCPNCRSIFNLIL